MLLNNYPVIGYGSECITFAKNTLTPNLISKILFSNNSPKTIQNELLLNKIDPNNSIHIPILSYKKLQSIPPSILNIINEYITLFNIKQPITLWQIDMEFGGQRLSIIKDIKKLLSKLLIILQHIIILSKHNIVMNDLHLDNILFIENNVKLIDFGNIEKCENALQKNLNNFCEMLQENVKIKYKMELKQIQQLLNDFSLSSENAYQIYNEWLNKYYI